MEELDSIGFENETAKVLVAQIAAGTKAGAQQDRDDERAFEARFPMLASVGMPLSALRRDADARPGLDLRARLQRLEDTIDTLRVEGFWPLTRPGLDSAALGELVALLGRSATFAQILTAAPMNEATALAVRALEELRASRQQRETYKRRRAGLEAKTQPPTYEDLESESDGWGDLTERLDAIATPPRGRRMSHYAVRRAPELVALLVDLWDECPPDKHPATTMLAAALDRADEGRRVDFADALLWVVRGLMPGVVDLRAEGEREKLKKRYLAHRGKLTAKIDVSIGAVIAKHDAAAAERARAADEADGAVRLALKQLQRMETK